MGGEEKYYNNLKQQQQQNRKKNLARNLVDHVSLLCIKGYFILKIIYDDYPLWFFFFACEWESQIVESVIVVFLRSQLKLN